MWLWPAEYGLILAAGGSEGKEISFFVHRGTRWRSVGRPRPVQPPWRQVLLRAPPPRHLDGWSPQPVAPCAFGAQPTWSVQQELVEGPGPVVRDVSWRPYLGIPSSSVAACFEDGLIHIWSQEMEGQTWNALASWSVNDEAWRLAWSKAGCMLAVSSGTDSCQLSKRRWWGNGMNFARWRNDILGLQVATAQTCCASWP